MDIPTVSDHLPGVTTALRWQPGPTKRFVYGIAQPATRWRLCADSHPQSIVSHLAPMAHIWSVGARTAACMCGTHAPGNCAKCWMAMWASSHGLHLALMA